MFDLSCGVRLRAFRATPASDIDNILSMYNNAEVAPWISDFLVPRGRKLQDEMCKRIESAAEIFCIIETIQSPSELTKPDSSNLPEFVGITALWAQGERGNRHTSFAIGLMPQFWSKGYGTEIAKFVINHAFTQMNIHRISLQVYEGNDRALLLYKKIGFVEEGKMRKARWMNGKWIDTISMGILVEEWMQTD